MACFAAPATVAIITTVIKKKVPERYHPEWLLLMLWGGVLMLIVDHIATGEIVAYFPFFTRSWQQIWPEILRVGVPMTIVIFATWAMMVWISMGLKMSSRSMAERSVK